MGLNFSRNMELYYSGELMSETVNIEMHILKQHTSKVVDLIKTLDGITIRLTEDYQTDPHITFFTVEEVPYGELQAITVMRQECIPYTIYWETCGYFNEGLEHLRFTSEGEQRLIHRFIEDQEISLDLLHQNIDNYQALKRLILQAKKDNEVLPWDNQDKYCVIGRTRKLIT